MHSSIGKYKEVILFNEKGIKITLQILMINESKSEKYISNQKIRLMVEQNFIYDLYEIDFTLETLTELLASKFSNAVIDDKNLETD